MILSSVPRVSTIMDYTLAMMIVCITIFRRHRARLIMQRSITRPIVLPNTSSSHWVSTHTNMDWSVRLIYFMLPKDHWWSVNLTSSACIHDIIISYGRNIYVWQRWDIWLRRSSVTHWMIIKYILSHYHQHSN